MGNSSDKKQFIEKLLQIEYEKKGFLLEDDIIDACIEHDLDLVEIDSLCDKLLHQKMIVKDTETKKDSSNNETIIKRKMTILKKLQIVNNWLLTLQSSPFAPNSPILKNEYF